MSKVAVRPALFRWARERSGRTLDELNDKFPKLEAWESESAQPTLRQIENFARFTKTPLGYLFLENPPDESLPIPQFRTQGAAAPSRPSPDLIDTIQTMQRRQDWLRDTLIEDHEAPLAFIGAAKIQDNVQTVAARMRDGLGLGPKWAQSHSTWEAALRALRRSMDSAGIVVTANGIVGNNTHRPLDPEEFRGFVLVDEYAPLVFVNSADSTGAQMFTLAHELAHLWFGKSAIFDLKDLLPANEALELACNAVAAEFLVPEVELRNVWAAAQKDANPFDRLAKTFKVSGIVVARRALDLHLVSREEFFKFYHQSQALFAALKAKRKQDSTGGPDFFVSQTLRLGNRFAVAVLHAAREGRLTYKGAYELTGLWGATFEKLASRLGFGELS